LTGARDIAIGFGLASVALVIALAVWPRSGVSGTIYEFVCRSETANAGCSAVAVTASISVTGYRFEKPYQPSHFGTWQTKSNGDGHFDLDLPPGGYWLGAQTSGSQNGATSFAVFPGQKTHVQILLFPAITGGICLPSGDRIATPTGSVPVTQVRPGMMVWTLDASGRRIAAPVLLVSQRPAASGHYLVHVVLSDGRVVEASPGHPTADGRLVGELTRGATLDGSRIIAVELLKYSGDTWDLLPAGGTGAYWANGVLLGSTLVEHPGTVN
jgi:hypothetical protein